MGPSALSARSHRGTTGAPTAPFAPRPVRLPPRKPSARSVRPRELLFHCALPLRKAPPMVAAHREGPGITRPTIAVLRGATMTFQLPDLPYSHDALQPFMSKETLEFHHDKHHQAYVTNGNKLLEGSGLEGKSLEEVVKGSFGKNAGLFNNAGQHYNHIHFWKWMKKGGGGKSLPGALQKAVNSDLGGYDKLRAD